MRLHSDKLTAGDLATALMAEQEAGRIAPHVTFKTYEVHRSSIRKAAFEVQLEAAYRDNGRRAGNSGSYGAMIPEHDGYAATYDEWGWLLAALYAIDPSMVVGTPKLPIYADHEDFDERTAWTYNPRRWLEYVLDGPTFADERDPFPIVVGQAARTKRGYMIGRRGADRVRLDGRRIYGPYKDRPRTVAEVREFAKLDAEVAP